MNEAETKPRLLIADDEAANISALVTTLRDYGTITVARNGTEAFERGMAFKPDLFLLDIKMPGLDGYEVCRRIRSTPPLISVPVIFITSLDAEQDESLGFEVGANDYITKPFSPSIVLARVKTQIDLKRHRDHLEALAEDRARQLVHSERLATLGTLAAGVAHEINNPLACISAYAELLARMQKKTVAESLPLLIEKFGADNPVVWFVERCGEYAATMFESCDRITRIVSAMKTYSKKEKDEPQPTALIDCISKSLQLCAHAVKYHVQAVVDVTDDLPLLLVQPQQIEQVLINLINNASHAIQETGEEGLITLTARQQGETVVLTVDDTGPGIPAGKLDSIWEAFYTSKGDKGTGLGLSISRGIIEDHNGSISAENRAEGGARFTIILPVPKNQT